MKKEFRLANYWPFFFITGIIVGLSSLILTKEESLDLRMEWSFIHPLGLILFIVGIVFFVLGGIFTFIWIIKDRKIQKHLNNKGIKSKYQKKIDKTV